MGLWGNITRGNWRFGPKPLRPRLGRQRRRSSFVLETMESRALLSSSLLAPSSLTQALAANAHDHAFLSLSHQTHLVSPLVAADREEHNDRIETSPPPVVPSNGSARSEFATTSLTNGGNAAHDGTPLTFTTHVAAQVPVHLVTGTFLVGIDGTAPGTSTITAGAPMLPGIPALSTAALGGHTLIVIETGGLNRAPAAAAQALVASVPASTNTATAPDRMSYVAPLNLGAAIVSSVTGATTTGTVNYRVDDTSVATAGVTGGTAPVSFIPAPPTLPPGNPTLTVTFSANTGHTTSTSASVTSAATLSTMLRWKHGQFLLTVLDNGQPVQQFTLDAPPTIQWRDVNADGIDDLVICIKEGTKPVVVAAFSGADAIRLV